MQQPSAITVVEDATVRILRIDIVWGVLKDSL
jgi:hypothetical protein